MSARAQAKDAPRAAVEVLVVMVSSLLNKWFATLWSLNISSPEVPFGYTASETMFMNLAKSARAQRFKVVGSEAAATHSRTTVCHRRDKGRQNRSCHQAQ